MISYFLPKSAGISHRSSVSRLSIFVSNLFFANQSSALFIKSKILALSGVFLRFVLHFHSETRLIARLESE
jgi:hypothetical protein